MTRQRELCKLQFARLPVLIYSSAIHILGTVELVSLRLNFSRKMTNSLWFFNLKGLLFIVN